MEFFDVVNECGVPTGEVVSRDEAHRDGIRHRTAHVWVIRAKNSGSETGEQASAENTGNSANAGKPGDQASATSAYEVLLQKRSMEKESYPGQYDTSSAGHIPAGEEPLESALRELREELGIEATPEQLHYAGMFRIKYEEEFHGKPFRDNEVTRVYVYWEPVDESKLTLQASEVDEVRWFDLDEVWEEIQTDRSRICVAAEGMAVLRKYLSSMTMKAVCRLVGESLFLEQSGSVAETDDATADAIQGGANSSAEPYVCDWHAVYAEMKAQTVAALPLKWLESHSLIEDSPAAAAKAAAQQKSSAEVAAADEAAGTAKSAAVEKSADTSTDTSALKAKWLRNCLWHQAHWIKVMTGQQLMLKLLEEHGIACVIIKGGAAAMAYPNPSLRAAGDVDFLVKRADYETAAKLLEENGYELSHGRNPKHHHYCYAKDGVSFELHRRVGILAETDEELLARFEDGIDRREFAKLGDFEFPVLPTELNGLTLMFHINQHLRSGLGLRQIADWMMYLERNDNLEELLPIFRETGMERLALTVTVLCQKYLGLRQFVEDTGEYPVEELLEYIFEKGNFGKKSGQEGKVASVFMVVTNPVRLFKRLQDGGMSRWKAAGRHKALRPFAWIYQIGFILRELSASGISPKKMAEQRKTGAEQRELIRKLGLGIDRHW